MNPEDNVIDAIDELVNWQLSRGESWANSPNTTCPPWTACQMFGFGEHDDE